MFYLKTKPYQKRHLGLTLGTTVFYSSVVVVLPLFALIGSSFGLGFSGILEIFSEERIQTALVLSFGLGIVSALFNLFIGFLFAWVLVRYDFPGKKLIDTLVDLPFTLPTAVAGIALTTIYSKNGILGAPFSTIGIDIAYTPIGITIALIFVGFPFVVRCVQPVLEEFPKEWEESAKCLGASPFQTFRKVILPELYPAILTGTGMAFARSIGEYGSVVFISGNIPGKTEILPLLIVSKLEQYDYAGATGIAIVMLSVSFGIMFFLNMIQTKMSKKFV